MIKYIHSMFNYSVPYKNKYIIYNTYSGALMLLNADEKTKFDNLELANKTKDVLEWKDNGFLIDKESNELEIVNYCRIRDTFSNRKTTFRILTTTACNARCFYCYENNVKFETMTKKTAVEVIEFIKNNSSEVNKIVLSWFGGEPLINYEIITFIIEKLKKEIPGKEIVSFITTNGLLFTKEVIIEAKEWNLKSIQITLDGLKKTYNKRKNYFSNIDGFTIVLNNIENLLKNGFGVTIRINYDNDNISEMGDLIKYLKKKFGNFKNLNVYSYHIFDTTSNYGKYNNEDLEIKQEYMNNLLINLGFNNILQLPRQKLNSCFATYNNSFVITPKGDLYKCAMAIKNPKQKIGNVSTPIALSKALIDWQQPQLPEKCSRCSLLPICQGGCRAARILNLNMEDCTIFKYSLNSILKRYVENNLKVEGGEQE